MNHPVLHALRTRPRGARLALVVEGIPTWRDPASNRELISRARLLRGRPVVHVRGLIEERYERLSPGLFAAALAARTELHPLATAVSSGEAVDLHARISDPGTLRTAVRASATLALLAGAPVALGDERFLDAGLTAAIPLAAALAGGATHIVVLRSRPQGETTPPIPRWHLTCSRSAPLRARRCPPASIATSRWWPRRCRRAARPPTRR